MQNDHVGFASVVKETFWGGVGGQSAAPCAGRQQNNGYGIQLNSQNETNKGSRHGSNTLDSNTNDIKYKLI